MQVSTTNIVFIVCIITCILFIAAVSLLTYVRLYNERKRKHFEEKRIMTSEFDKQLMQSQLETQEETMSILSKELHDNIGQLLNSTKLLIGVTQRNLNHAPETLITADETLAKAIQELRSLSKSLDKDWLAQFNFIENLEAEIRRIHSARSLHIYFSRPDILPLKANEQIILFRIVQETIQNAIKHADPKSIYITIKEVTTHLSISITDDGSGFEDENKLNGMGILNIRHRTYLLGGTVQWKAHTTGGTVVTIQLPVNKSDT